jgi:adenylylsulfate kinase-like enzyme
VDPQRLRPTEFAAMIPEMPSVSQLSQVISQAAAPAFLLGALAAFIALLMARLNRIIDRTAVLNAILDGDAARSRLKADLPRLLRRAAMINRAIFWAVIASITITFMVIVAFVSAFFQIQHERGVAVLFLISLGAFIAALVDFAREVRIALSEFDHYA